MSINDLIKAIGGSSENLRPTTALEKKLSVSLYSVGAAQGLYFSAYFIYKLFSAEGQMSIASMACLYVCMSCSMLVFCVGAYRLYRFKLVSFAGSHSTSGRSRSINIDHTTAHAESIVGSR